VPRQRLAIWLQEEADGLSEEDLSATLAAPEADDVLELDELWSFVQKKSQKRWIWFAVCRRTKQIVAWVIGDRSEATSGSYGDASRRPIGIVIHSATSGRLISRFFRKRRIRRSARRVDRPHMLSAGTTSCGNDWHGLCVGRSPFPNQTTSIIWC